ncbi:hypothetical protein D3C80_1317980 [compost metagenome]
MPPVRAVVLHRSPGSAVGRAPCAGPVIRKPVAMPPCSPGWPRTGSTPRHDHAPASVGSLVRASAGPAAPSSQSVPARAGSARREGSGHRCRAGARGLCSAARAAGRRSPPPAGKTARKSPVRAPDPAGYARRGDRRRHSQAGLHPGTSSFARPGYALAPGPHQPTSAPPAARHPGCRGSGPCEPPASRQKPRSIAGWPGCFPAPGPIAGHLHAPCPAPARRTRHHDCG